MLVSTHPNREHLNEKENQSKPGPSGPVAAVFSQDTPQCHPQNIIRFHISLSTLGLSKAQFSPLTRRTSPERHRKMDGHRHLAKGRGKEDPALTDKGREALALLRLRQEGEEEGRSTHGRCSPCSCHLGT